MPALDGEYYTPPVSQVKVSQVSKVSAPPNLPIFLGQEPVSSTEGSIDQWLFQVEGPFSHPYKGSSQISCNRASKRSCL